MKQNLVEKNIRSYSLEGLTELFKTMNEPLYRAQQVHDWLWKKSVHSFSDMNNLSKELRQKLLENFIINEVKIDAVQVSKDRTIKTIFKLHDGNFIEGVLIPTTDRITACISSQVGCSLNCKFCATGYMEIKRNLYAEEIYDQVVLIRSQAMEHYKQSLTNIVFMGMGEPLLNYNQVLGAIEKINSPDGLGIASRRITVSTAGISKMIKKLGDDQVKFNLALSLHAADDVKRNKIMPINETNSLKSLIEALNYFFSKTKRPITFEYILFDKFNDSIEDAKQLVTLCRRIPSKVNIIEYNQIDDAKFRKSGELKRDAFIQYLSLEKINVNFRRSRGKDINAACGQLANKLQ